VTQAATASLAWVGRAIGGGVIQRVGTARRGSTSTLPLDVTSSGGTTQRLLLRVFDDRGRLRDDPWYQPSWEVEVLYLLQPLPLPVPRLVAADPVGEATGLPMVLTTRLPGRPPPRRPADRDAFLRSLAGPLPALHAVPAPLGLRSHAPSYSPDELAVPPWSRRAGLWERVLETIATPATRRPPSRFIHRHYHHHNTLWRGPGLTGVVDWTTGCRGPAAVDLARARLNLALDHGVEWADRFAEVHRSLAGEDVVDPWWDLVAAADTIPDLRAPRTRAETARIDRFEDYVAARLSLTTER
jgi:aminoglycoside phosphotransferase (APT) family kinase protein